MKTCSDCNVEMIEDTNIHTDYVGGVDFETQIYLDYADDENGSKMQKLRTGGNGMLSGRDRGLAFARNRRL